MTTDSVLARYISDRWFEDARFDEEAVDQCNEEVRLRAGRMLLAVKQVAQ